MKPIVIKLTVKANQKPGTIDIVSQYGGVSHFTQLSNFGVNSKQDVQVQLNGSDDAIFWLPCNCTQVFNRGDVDITSLAFIGGKADTDVQAILSIQE